MARPTTSRAAAGVVAALVVALLVACTGQPTETITPEHDPAFPRFTTDPLVPVDPNVRYGTAQDGSPLRLDVCLPPDHSNDDDPDGTDAATPSPATNQAPRAAILMVHGGSWTRGDKATIPYRSVCQWLARGTGFVVFNIDYQLAPAHPYPAAIRDLRTAVRWIRSPAQVATYDVDPDRVGAFGGSAGGNLVSLLGTEGTGRLDRGTRVAAVVELSGPVDLTGVNQAERLLPDQLGYLGCTNLDRCPTAVPASAATWIDRTDPPFLIGHSTHEFIPLGQSVDFVAALRKAGVSATLIKVAGTNHSITMLPGNPTLQARILTFFREKLSTSGAR